MQVIPDTIDFSEYMRMTEAAVKVKRASAFGEELKAQFHDRTEARKPEMFSTKLRGLLEFRPGEVTVWAGYNGHRKSMFTGQVALDLCVQRQRVMVASFEMQPHRTLARMARQASGTAKPGDGWLDAFSRWTDGRLWMFDHLGRITPDVCIAVCRYFAEELKGSQVFIDSMMMVCASEESLDEQKQFITDLVRLAKETDLHVHLVAHCRKPQSGEEHPPKRYDLRGSAAISDQADNVVTVWANKAKQAKLGENAYDEAALSMPDALVTVCKQRAGDFEGACKLWFDVASLRFCDDRISPAVPYDLRLGRMEEAA